MTKKTRIARNILLSCTALSFTAFAAAAAYAQDTAAPNDARNATDGQTSGGDGQPAAQNSQAAQTTATEAGENIVVTARRREELLLDTPISVTALSGATLEQQNVSSITEIAVPSLAVSVQASLRHLVSFAIRGQRSQESQVLTDPPVGTYFAEVVQPRPYGFGNSLYDIQSVQVLKGVQGTLFGRNMTGGAVLVEPNHPTFDFSGEVRAQYGNFNHRDLLGILNVPLGSVAAFRIAGVIRRRDGFSRDVSNGRDYDDQHYESARASLLLRPTEPLESLFIFDYFNSNEHGTAAFMTDMNFATGPIAQQERLRQQGIPLANLPAQLANARALFAAHRYRLDMGAGEPSSGIYDAPGVLPYETMRNWGVQNKTSWDFGGATLKNIFGYRELRRENVQDYDGIPAVLINPFQTTRLRNISEELQLQGTLFGGRLNYTTGGYYFQERGFDGARPNTLPELALLGRFGVANVGRIPGSANVQQTIGRGTATTYAAYLAGTFELSDRWSISGGIRYNHDRRSARLNPFRIADNVCLFDSDDNPQTPAPPIAQCVFTNSKSWNAITWDATLQFEPDDTTTLYASTRRGFRAGGFSLRAQQRAALAPFNPETVQEYELGLKNQFRLGGARLQTSAAVFYQDYNNVQRQAPTGIDTNGDGQADTVVTIIRNISKVANRGLELEANIDFGNGLSIAPYYSFVDVNVKRGLLPGEHEMRGIPKHQLGARINYMFPVSENVGEILASVSFAYQSEVELDDFDVQGHEQGYALVRGRLSWDRIGGSNFGAALWVNNAFNQLYRVGVLGLVREVGFISSVYGEPRTYGAEVSYRF